GATSCVRVPLRSSPLPFRPRARDRLLSLLLMARYLIVRAHPIAAPVDPKVARAAAVVYKRRSRSARPMRSTSTLVSRASRRYLVPIMLLPVFAIFAVRVSGIRDARLVAGGSYAPRSYDARVTNRESWVKDV